MFVSLKWLQNYLDLPLESAEVERRLTMAGLEVERVEHRGQALKNVVTALVRNIRKHPGADRLHICEVSVGVKTYQVVCGAPNVELGGIAALALPGVRLPDGMEIQECHVRGELSQGMLCSQRELGVGEDGDGIWLLPPATPVGVPVAEALGIEDAILELSVTPNRSDCLSVIGIAREVAALFGAPLRYPAVDYSEQGPGIESLSSVTVHDPIGCPRYAARIVEGVTIGPSPAWLRARLESVGLRSINNIVDVTNYILMEMGQPLHAFDFDRLAENRIVVRLAKSGERFTTLDKVERTLFDDTLLICDGQGPVAIAGIMGGLNSEIEPGTTRVFIESAYFQPQSIRRTSKKLGLRTESSYRFERGVDPEGLISALDRAAQLMVEVGGGRLATGRLDVYPEPIAQPVLTLRVDRTNRFLGTALSLSHMADILRSIEMQVEPLDGNRLQVIPPPFRRDVTREVDLAEEIARLAGYNTIPSTFPLVQVAAAVPDAHQQAREQVRTALTGFGFSEVLNYSFVSLNSLLQLRLSADDRRSTPLRVQNPLSEDQAVLRTSLIPGLLQTAARNFDYRNDNLRLFELSKVFLPQSSSEQPEERYHLTGLLSGLRDRQPLYGGDAKVDYTDVKGTVQAIAELFHLRPCQYLKEPMEPYLSPREAAAIVCGSKHIGSIGRLHPDVERACDFKTPIYLFELDFDLLFEAKQPQPFFQALPKFPAVIRDMALIVDEILPAQAPLDLITAQGEQLLEHVELFDLYQDTHLGEGKKSVGYRLVYRAADRSLTDEEVNGIHEQMVRKVLAAFHAKLR